MNETSLSITQTLIERTLVENLRLEAVHYGYMPDITKFSRTPSGYEDYKAAQRKVADEKGFCIDVLNNLAPVEMGEKKFARMVVRTVQCIPGEFGQWGRTQYTLGTDGKFTRYELPPQPVNYVMQIHLVYNNINQGRVLNAILAKAIPRRGYHKITKMVYDGIELPDELPTFFCELLTSNLYPNAENNTQEDVYRYNIPDAWDVVVVRAQEEGISPLLEVNLFMDLIQVNETQLYFQVK